MITKYFLLITMSLLMGGCFGILPDSVEFVSFESKHLNGDPIYNRVKFEKHGSEDVWLMQQQQGTYNVHHETWDKLAITVNTETNVVQYYQLEPGPLTWSDLEPTRTIAPKVNCLKCHANGPRLIRPDPEYKISWTDSAKIWFLNERMKKYPRLSAENRQELNSRTSAKMQEPLLTKACTKCHNENPSGRNFLSREHRATITFMLQHDLMPPRGKRLSPREKQLILDFLQ